MNDTINYKILIVDDVPKNIQILGNILSRENYQIAYAQYDTEALKVVEKQNFDLILLDIMMPGMSGYQICKKLKSKPKTAEIPIIFLTAKADLESVVKGFESGGQDYITKPFNALELLARVKTHIQLNVQKKELKELNTKLEEKVNERTRQLQKANRQLSVLDKAKTDFLSIISHELRTPLNGVIGLTTLLDQTELNQEQREYIEFLKETSDRLMSFSQIALLITSLKVEKYAPDMMPIAIGNIIETVVYSLKEIEKETVPEININIENPSAMVFAESELLQKSCLLILQNSCKYGGLKNPVDINVYENKNKLHIVFDDHGEGFSKEALDKLFELFAADDLMHNEGTGLSLAAVKLIMDIHNSRIIIKNRKNGGGHVELIMNMYKK